MSRVLMDSAAIESAIQSIADQLLANGQDGPWAIVGIRRGGEALAKRLAARMGEKTGQEVSIGMVDITLYRDDGFGPNDFPSVGVTDIPFVLKEHTVVLVDDVLYTGRTVRAAIDAILDYGRPKAVRLAVLVDRGLRELPIRADAAGTAIDTTAGQHVDVRVNQTASGTDEVRISEREGAES